MKAKSKALALALVTIGVLFMGATSMVHVSETVISRAVINAPMEEVITWLTTDGEGINVNKDTGAITYSWGPGLTVTPIDGLTGGGGSYNYEMDLAGHKFKGEGVDVGPYPAKPKVPSRIVYSGDMDCDATEIYIPLENGTKTKMILLVNCEFDVPAKDEKKVREAFLNLMTNAIPKIKQGVEKKKAGG